jgi:hypothetical protein
LVIPETAIAQGWVTVQVVLNRLACTPALARAAEGTFMGELKQVAFFLTDLSDKPNVLTDLRAHIGSDSQVLIGHSLGLVLTRKYLLRYHLPGVELLITYGSPISIPDESHAIDRYLNNRETGRALGDLLG